MFEVCLVSLVFWWYLARLIDFWCHLVSHIIFWCCLFRCHPCISSLRSCRLAHIYMYKRKYQRKACIHNTTNRVLKIKSRPWNCSFGNMIRNPTCFRYKMVRPAPTFPSLLPRSIMKYKLLKGVKTGGSDQVGPWVKTGQNGFRSDQSWEIFF